MDKNERRRTKMIIKVYLGDLTHDGTGKYATDLIPYNIGLIASYAKAKLGDKVEIRLFKYAEKLIEALKENPPDILGLSNYCWNAYQSEWICQIAKKIKPDIITVKGGTNYPFKAHAQQLFFQEFKFTDFHIFYEGEVAFVNLCNAYLAEQKLNKLKETPIASIQSLSPSSGNLVSGPTEPRLKNLDDVPSPYLTGILDEFFDGNLAPVLESTRGCPFTCNFCNAGDKYYHKIGKFSLDRIEKEIHYIGKKVRSIGIHNLILADNNFGMFPHDAEMSQLFAEARDEYGWPLSIYATTGKNNKPRILEATGILGNMLTVNMSVQSMNKNVLKNILRDNISVDTYKDINEQLSKEGRNGNGEVIVPLPGETLETYLEGIRDLIDQKVQIILSYTLLVIHGTPYKDDSQYVKDWGYKMKWRVIPNQFGTYDGKKIFDFEQVAIESKDMPFSDYLLIRDFALITELAYNANVFGEILKYLREIEISPFDWLRLIYDNIDSAPGPILKVVASFRNATKKELWPTKTDLVKHYEKPENYKKLVNGDAGYNVVFTHKAWVLSEFSEIWVDFIANFAREIIKGKLRVNTLPTSYDEQIHDITVHMKNKINSSFINEREIDNIYVKCNYNIRDWLLDPDNKLDAYKGKKPLRVCYYFTNIQLVDRMEAKRRYGDSLIGKAKLLSHRGLPGSYRNIEVQGVDDVENSYIPISRSGTVAKRNP